MGLPGEPMYLFSPQMVDQAKIWAQVCRIPQESTCPHYTLRVPEESAQPDHPPSGHHLARTEFGWLSTLWLLNATDEHHQTPEKSTFPQTGEVVFGNRTREGAGEHAAQLSLVSITIFEILREDTASMEEEIQTLKRGVICRKK